MANGATQSKMQFKKRTISHEQRPDAPEGEWEALIPKGKCKPVQTAAEKGGDPGILIQIKLEKAADEKNESFQGALVPLRMYFYDGSDPDKRKGANANLRTATDLAEACGLDLKDVYPDEIESEDDLWAIIEKLEGKRFTVWTVHRASQMPNGDKTVNVDIRFKEPGAGLATRTAEDDDNDERPSKQARGGGKGKSRR